MTSHGTRRASAPDAVRRVRRVGEICLWLLVIAAAVIAAFWAAGRLRIVILPSNIFEPVVVGKTVKLHPLAILLAVALGVAIAGILGALVATPIVAVGGALLDRRAGGDHADRWSRALQLLAAALSLLGLVLVAVGRLGGQPRPLLGALTLLACIVRRRFVLARDRLVLLRLFLVMLGLSGALARLRREAPGPLQLRVGLLAVCLLLAAKLRLEPLPSPPALPQQVTDKQSRQQQRRGDDHDYDPGIHSLFLQSWGKVPLPRSPGIHALPPSATRSAST